MSEKIQQTVSHILSLVKTKPVAGIILGSGLGGLVKEISVEHSLGYSDIPNFPVSTVAGHQGKLIFGKLSGKNVVVMQGRFHFYEGYSMQEITFPVRVMKFLGIKNLFISNAAGGVNPAYQIGDLMIIRDHINLMPSNPLIGKNSESLGLRFPDMSEPYNKNIISRAKEIAERKNIRAHVGVYAAVSGPTFETQAEYRYIRTIGGDAVGMSTVPEAIVAVHMKLSCFAVSVITDLGGMEEQVPVSHLDVLKAAEEAEGKLTHIFKELISSLD
ncbi:MAG TPA: purine-nucleoside phosphorylase [Bacteroidia bacterium]|nr:purine-nucleoside phosphorylase [Bacteroidia bacterium]